MNSRRSGTPIDSSGSGLVGPFYTELDLTNSVMVGCFLNLFANPQADYINIHTNLHPGGIMRAQLRTADTMTFPITLDSANEVPNTVSFKGTAPTGSDDEKVMLRSLVQQDLGRMSAN